MTKNVLESGLLQENGAEYVLTGPLPQLAIPPTLQDSLMARFDRMDTAREVAQFGAVIGREFGYALLKTISAKDEALLQHGLDQLVETELIYQRGLPPESHYTFKHALIQDAAYQSLLKSKRQTVYTQIAQALEKNSLSGEVSQPELLAHHYTEAGLADRAVPYWQQAGQVAVERSADAEAVVHFSTGLRLLETLLESPERLQQELERQLQLGGPLATTMNYSAPEVEAVYLRAQPLCQRLGETVELGHISLVLSRLYSLRGEIGRVREIAETAHRLGQSIEDPDLLVAAHYLLGAYLVWHGDWRGAQAHFEQAVAYATLGNISLRDCATGRILKLLR
jgi:predicted ATPase